MKFGEAIDSSGCSLLVFFTWCVIRFLAEDIVGANVHYKASNLFHGFGKIARGGGIEGFDNRSSRLGSVNVGPSSTVDDATNVLLLHHATDVVTISDIEVLIALAHISEDVMVATILRDDLNFLAQLAIGTGY